METKEILVLKERLEIKEMLVQQVVVERLDLMEHL